MQTDCILKLSNYNPFDKAKELYQYDGDEAILEKDRTGKDGKLKICKDKYMKVDCKNLLLEKKKYRRASGDGE